MPQPKQVRSPLPLLYTSPMSCAVLEEFPLGFQWPTQDPFLFCVHHHDAYPHGDGELAPASSLAGRELGQDFAGKDGWRMYHGTRVPGFPQHPHRGFETVTIVRQGFVDHCDSLGAAARYGGGDVQWLTAGAGIVHSEMFPLLHKDQPNPLELFQIWVNLPQQDKLVAPHFKMLWDGQLPTWTSDGVNVRVIAGTFGGRTPPPPPPNSWAARPEADVAIWCSRLEPSARLTLPPATQPRARRTLYVYSKSEFVVDNHRYRGPLGLVVDASKVVTLVATDTAVECLLLQGCPIGEPVAQYGPFVMNDREQLQQAFVDYQRTGFGGWPWASDDPVHANEPRFARQPDGTFQYPDVVAQR